MIDNMADYFGSGMIINDQQTRNTVVESGPRLLALRAQGAEVCPILPVSPLLPWYIPARATAMRTVKLVMSGMPEPLSVTRVNPNPERTIRVQVLPSINNNAMTEFDPASYYGMAGPLP